MATTVPFLPINNNEGGIGSSSKRFAEICGTKGDFNTLNLNSSLPTATTSDLAQSVLPFTYKGAAATYDLNSYRTAGIWTLYNIADDSTNFPDGWGTGTNGACILEVIPFYSNTYVRQMLHKRSTSEIWIRYSTSATAWGAWRKMSPENYGICSIAAATAAKTVALPGFTLTDGSRVTVRFTTANTHATPTLNVASTGAKAMYVKGNRIGTGYQYLQANGVYDFIYNASLDYYELVTDDSKISVGGDAGTVGGKTVAQIVGSVVGANLWVSGEYTPALNTPTIVNHGISGLDPLKARGEVLLKCVVAEGGYSVGDFAISPAVILDAGGILPIVPLLKTDIIQINTGSYMHAPYGFTAMLKTSGNYFHPTYTSWRYIFRIWY